MTEMLPLAEPDPHDIDPRRLVQALRDTGWELLGEDPGVYSRLAPRGTGERPSGEMLFVPLNPAAPEFDHLMGRVLERLAHDRQVGVSVVTAAAAIDAADAFIVRAESAMPSGLIGWRAGERMFTAFGDTLRAGAKAFVAPQARFSNRHGRFATTFLDAVLMGQTRLGSFAITAYVPVQHTFPEPTTTYGDGDIGRTGGRDAVPGRYSIQGRDVTRTLAGALQATSTAISLSHETGSLAPFTDGVGAGVSHELTRSLHTIVADAPQAEISIEWDDAQPVTTLPSHFSFTREDAPLLKNASELLARPGLPERTVVIGRPIHPYRLGQRGHGQPGVIGIRVGNGDRNLRARFESEEDVDRVIDALRNGRAIRASGDRVREGSITWLYNARLNAVLGERELPKGG